MGLGKRIRDSFVTGIIIAGPLLVTIFIFQLLFNWTVGAINPIVQGTRLTQWTANIEIAAQLLALGVILLMILLVGFLAQLSVGRRTLGSLGRIVDLIPLFRSVYGGVRQVANSLVEQNDQYERVAFVEFREGVYSVGLVTGRAPKMLRDETGQKVYNVYLPAALNPTNGSLLFVPEDRMYETDMRTRQAIRLLMTTGVGADEKGEVPESDVLPPHIQS